MTLLPFDLPSIVHDGPIPKWDGEFFKVGNDSISVLEYSTNLSGWNDNLTSFHEEAAQENHFIDEASRQHAIDQIHQYVKIDKPVILEIGCSSGYMLKALREEKPNAVIMGADVVHQPLLDLAKNLKTVPLLRFDLVHCPLPDNSVDVIILLNVLEHVEKDATAFAQIQRILKPGGVAIIEVPAGPDLYDVYDKILLHYRRYELSQLCELAQTAGLNILKKSHLGFFMYPGFWAVKKRNRRFMKEAEALQKQQVEQNIRSTGSSRLLKQCMQLELALGKKISYPFGIRCLLTCQKI